MGGDAKCVQHKIVLPMYVSYTSIPTSTANTTMKSTKLLTNPYLDVTTTSTSAATCNLDKSIINNVHNNNNINNNSNQQQQHQMRNQKTIFNEIDQKTGTTNDGDDDNDSMEKCGKSFYSMSYNPYKCTNIDDRIQTPKKLMTNPLRSDHIHKRNNGIVYRNSSQLCAVANGYQQRTPRYSDSDDTRSSSIDYNFNYVKFRSPLNATTAINKSTSYRDSSTTSTECTSSFLRNASKYMDIDDKKQSIILPKVHNHPNCQCNIQYYCPFAGINEHNENQTKYGMHERKCFAPRYPYKRRDLNPNPINYDHKINDSPPEYDQIDDFLMKRTFSHDRLFSQRRITAIRSRTRPKSYCSNVNHYPTQL